jgi:HK97 family phage major capsid protein
MPANINALRGEIAKRIEEGNRITAQADSETRALNSNESTRYAQLLAEAQSFRRDMDTAEAFAEVEKRALALPDLHNQRRGELSLRGYNVARTILTHGAGRALDGLEGEWNAELQRANAARGLEARGGVIIPFAALFARREQRDLTTTTPAAGPAGVMVGTDVLAASTHPYPITYVQRLGATMLPGLIGNLVAPTLSDSGTAAWIAENAPAPASDPVFTDGIMSPKTVAATYTLGRRIRQQTADAINPLVSNDLRNLLTGMLDKAAISGAGGLEPLGVTQTPGVAQIPLGASLSLTTSAMIGALEMDDYNGDTGFLTSPGVFRLARDSRDAIDRGFTVAEQFHGKPAYQTTQVPSKLGVGTNESAIVYGLWSELLVGLWSNGVEILADPYSASDQGALKLHSFLDADILVRDPKAFNWAQVPPGAFPVAP